MKLKLSRTNRFDLAFILISLLGVISVLLFSGFTVSSGHIKKTSQTVTVYAAAGTMMTMQQVGDQYESQSGVKVVLNFASSSTLARQIAAGAEYDVFISANSKWMDFVQEQALIDSGSRCDLLTDRLAVIIPIGADEVDGDTPIKQILASMTGSIAIGDAAHVPCGMYAKEALVALGCWESIQLRMIPASSVRAAQQYVESRQCELGIVYYASASQSDAVQIISVLDETLHSPIRFSAACANSSMQGNDFLQYLSRNTAMSIFSKAGFIPCVQRKLPNAPIASVESEFRVNTWQTLLISLKVATICTLVVAAPGIGLGYVLARKSFRGQALVNAIICIPMVIPPVVTGYLALQCLGKNSIFGTWIHENFGVSVAFSWIGAVVVSAIMGFPLLVRSVKTAVEMIDQRYSQAANTLGSGPVRTFFTITLPLAGPGVLAGLILAFARSLGEFGATTTFAGNIPGKTQTLSLAIYNFTQIPGAEATAIRLVGISVILSLIAMLGSELLTQRMKYLVGTT